MFLHSPRRHNAVIIRKLMPTLSAYFFNWWWLYANLPYPSITVINVHALNVSTYLFHFREMRVVHGSEPAPGHAILYEAVAVYFQWYCHLADSDATIAWKVHPATRNSVWQWLWPLNPWDVGKHCQGGLSYSMFNNEIWNHKRPFFIPDRWQWANFPIWFIDMAKPYYYLCGIILTRALYLCLRISPMWWKLFFDMSRTNALLGRITCQRSATVR